MPDPVPGAPVNDPAPVDTGLTPPGNILGDIPIADPAVPPAGDLPAGDPAAPPADDPPPDAGDKPPGDKPEPRAPETYAEFTIPDGLTMDEAGMTEFQALAKEQDLTQEQAQKLLEFGGSKIKDMVTAPYRMWNELQTTWQAEINADPEIGGTHLEDTIAAAAELYKISPSNPYVKSETEAKALQDALNLTGVGNNPAMVRLFARIGMSLREPAPLSGGVVPQEKNILDSLYPSMAKKQE